jgi:hypothetical protein
MPGKPAEHFLRGLGGDQHLRRPGQRNPFPDVRPQSFGLPAAAGPIPCLRLAHFYFF